MKKKLTQENFEIFSADNSAVEHAFENLLIKWARQIKAGGDSALDSLQSHAHRVLQMIFNLANEGNENAAKQLHAIISAHVSQFDEFSHRNAEFFEPIARKTTVWPALISCDKDIDRRGKKQSREDKPSRNEILISKLKLGADAALNYSGKQWTRRTIETKIAVQLWSEVECYRNAWLNRKAQKKLWDDEWKYLKAKTGKSESWFRSKLPKRKPLSPEMAEEFRLRGESETLARKLKPLNRQNYTKWAAAAKHLFCARYGKEFQNHKAFEKIRASAEKTYNRTKDGKNLRSHLRNLIWSGVKNGFKSIPRKPDKIK